jgi:hypothetical protein
MKCKHFKCDTNPYSAHTELTLTQKGGKQRYCYWHGHKLTISGLRWREVVNTVSAASIFIAEGSRTDEVLVVEQRVDC